MTANTPTTTATGPAAAAISPAAVGTTIRVDPHILTGFHRNPHHGDIGAIMASLIVNGQYKPIVVNLGRRTGRPGEVLAGNHTLTAFLHLNEQDPADPRWHTISVHVLDVDNDTATRIVLVDNRAFELGEGADTAAILDLVDAIGSAIGTGYTQDELDRLSAALAGTADSGDINSGSTGNTATDTAAEPPTPSPDSVNSYTIVFDTPSQQQVWFEFVEWLEKSFSDPDSTPVQRLSAFLAEMPPERRI
jgi:hypothetical protein